MAKVSEEVAALEAQLERTTKELEMEIRRNASLGAGQPPVRDIVFFVGGPLHFTSRAVPSKVIVSGLYRAAMSVPQRGYADYNSPPPELVTGEYRILKFATRDSYLMYNVAVWEGVR